MPETKTLPSLAPIEPKVHKRELKERHIRRSGIFDGIFPLVPGPGDELVHALLRGALQSLAEGRYGYARNQFELALTAPTRNKWMYHALAWFYLAKFEADAQRRPKLELLEKVLRLNPFMPDVLDAAMEQDHALVQRIVREATGLIHLEPEQFVALAKSGNWTEMIPYRTSDDTFRGKTILDIGARTGFHAISYLAMGAKFYTGMDVSYKAFVQSHVKNYFSTTHERIELGFTMREVADRHKKRMRLTRCGKKEFQDNQRYDFITMFAVSEHLKDPDMTLGQLGQWLAPGGRMLVSHHNFYSWNGHHNRPKTTIQLERMLAAGEDVQLADWNFFEAEFTNTHLNRLSVAEMRAVMEQHYKVERWEPAYTSVKKGMERISPEILKRHPGRTLDDLVIQQVFIELAHKSKVSEWKNWWAHRKQKKG